jgi:hypothetical protein
MDALHPDLTYIHKQKPFISCVLPIGISFLSSAGWLERKINHEDAAYRFVGRIGVDRTEREGQLYLCYIEFSIELCARLTIPFTSRSDPINAQSMMDQPEPGAILIQIAFDPVNHQSIDLELKVVRYIVEGGWSHINLVQVVSSSRAGLVGESLVWKRARQDAPGKVSLSPPGTG